MYWMRQKMKMMKQVKKNYPSDKQRLIKNFESFTTIDTLYIIDVSKHFSKFFTEQYLRRLKNHCHNYRNVIQVWDNHSDGKPDDDGYLYDPNFPSPISDDLYTFPNQTEIIEKRYTHQPKDEYIKELLGNEVFKDIIPEKLKKGQSFRTLKDTLLVYIGNNHKWFHCPKKLENTLLKSKGKKIHLVGGAETECYEDIIITAQSLGIEPYQDHRFIYSATHCPIK